MWQRCRHREIQALVKVGHQFHIFADSPDRFERGHVVAGAVRPRFQS
jgi:hypothetical protein